MRHAKKSMSVMVIFAVLIFNGCIKDHNNYPVPTIEFSTQSGYVFNDTSILLGDSILIGIVSQTNSDVALTHFHYTIASDSQITEIDTGIYLNEFNYNRLIIKGASENEVWSFYVRDRDGRKSKTISVKLVKNAESIYGGIETVSLVVLGAQNNTSNKSFYSLTTEQLYNIQEAYNNQSLINLLYYYDYIDLDENTISSPGANLDNSIFPGIYAISGWTVKNTTRFEYRSNISIEEFDAATNDSLIVYNSFEFSSGKRKAKNLTAGDIYSFETEQGKMGIFKVIEVSGLGEGIVKIQIKMQD
jgi:hypothetical protein